MRSGARHGRGCPRAGRTAAAWLAALAIGVLSAAAQAEEVFTATAEFEPVLGGGRREMAFTLSVTRPVSDADALELRRILADGGQQAFAVAIRSRTDGVLKLGALERPLNLVYSTPSSTGRLLVVVTARRLQVEEVNQGAESLDYPFGVAILDLDESGLGDGFLYPAAALGVNEDGEVIVHRYHEEPGRLRNVRQQR